jgi:fluoride ion exporter CrcB/FEX
MAREPLYASLYGAGAAVGGLCRYGMMALDASPLIKSVSAIQFPENVHGTRFCLLVATKVSLSLALMGKELVLNTIVERAERNIRQTRIRKVTASFHKMEYSSVIKANLRRFRDICANIHGYPAYFKESIQQLCKLAEIGSTALVVCHNMANMTLPLSMFCLAVTALNSIVVLFGLPLSLDREGFAVENESTNLLNGPKSLTVSKSCGPHPSR